MLKNRSMWIGYVVAVLVAVCVAQSAHAHVENGQAAGFFSGLHHPWSGWDHIFAMVAVGLWGAQLGAPAVWLLPVVFPMVMAVGGFMGLVGIPLPGVEIGIALSAILLGGMVLGEVKSKSKPFLVFAACLVGIFGLFHGHAHGTELPEGQSGLLYSIGFVMATGLLHALGITIGLIHRWPAGKIALRGAGALILLGGLYFLWNTFQAEEETAVLHRATHVAMVVTSR